MSRWGMRAAVTVAAGSLTALAAGCGETEHTVTLFDSCTEIPDETLEAIGVSREDQAPLDDGVGCSWENDERFVSVEGTWTDLEEFFTSLESTGSGTSATNTREMQYFEYEGGSPTCEFVLPTERGTIVIGGEFQWPDLEDEEFRVTQDCRELFGVVGLLEDDLPDNVEHYLL